MCHVTNITMYIFLANILLIVPNFGSSEELCNKEQTTSRAKLNGSQIEIISPSGPILCSKLCSSKPECTSFNFQQSSLTCELNVANQITDTLVNDDSYDYYDNKQITIDLGNCSQTECPNNSQCINIQQYGSYCNMYKCDEPPTIANGTLEPGSNLVGRSRNYKCLPGYLLHGSSSVTCLSTGTWTQNATYCEKEPQDCQDVFLMGHVTNGVYTIYRSTGHYDVYCDMDRNGWTVFQRRLNGSTNFYRTWNAYVTGFGNVNDEFWLGLNKIYEITSSKDSYVLRIDMEDYAGVWKYAMYSHFRLGTPSQKYRLIYDSYAGGDSGDALLYNKGYSFSTYDNDFNSCSLRYSGAWWYNDCHHANLNGLYGSTVYGKGIHWNQWHGHSYSLKTTEMKIRRM